MSCGSWPLRAVFPLLLAGCSGQYHPQNTQPRVAVTIGLIPYFRDLRTVRVAVGRDTLVFLFDTGGGVTLITPAAAGRIGCRPYGRDVGFRMTGEVVEFQRCDSLSLGFPGWSRHLEPIAVFDVNALLPAELPRLDGVLALDAFRGQVLSIDWPGARLIVHDPPASATALRTAGLPIRFATGETGRMVTALVQVTGRRGDLWLLLDSGNLQGTLLDSRVSRDSLLVLESDSLVALQVPSRPAIRVPVHLGNYILDGVLGTDYLQRGPVALDLRNLVP